MSIARSVRRFRPPALVAALSFALFAAAGPANAAGRWRVISSPSPSDQANYLSAVTTVSATEGWAVGAWYRPIATPGTLTEHWDGSAWTLVPSPNGTSGYNELYGVSAVASDDVWAVGYHNIANYGSEKTMALHWDGAAWTIVPTANLDQNANELLGVAAVSSDDVWAVGFGASTSNLVGRPLVQHWDGSSWSLVATPDTGSGFSSLTGITAISSTDVWAVGESGDHPLIEHWDGSAWSIVTGASSGGELYGVSAGGPDDVWAVGELVSGRHSTPLIEHWNGSAWSVVPSPRGRLPFTSLSSVSAVAPGDAWAVGATYDKLTVTFRTFTVHWNGSRWAAVGSPNPSREYDDLQGVTASAGGDVWAVGAHDIDTLVLRATAG